MARTMKKLIIITAVILISGLISGQQVRRKALTLPTLTVTGVGTVDSLLATDVTVTGNDAILLSGNATVWDDLMFPFTVGSQGFNTYPPVVRDSAYYAFAVDSAGNDAQYMQFVVQIPHNYKMGSTIYPHVHYKQETPSGTTPVFLVKYKWYNLTGTTRKGWSWLTMATATDTIRYTHQLVYNTAGIAGTGITQVSSIFVCNVYLKSLASGSTACNAWQFDIHYERDDMGSRTQLAK